MLKFLSPIVAPIKKAKSAYMGLPVPHRIGFGALPVVGFLVLLSSSHTLRSIIPATLIIIAVVVAVLLLLQFIVKRWERKKNAALSGALQKDSQEPSLLTDEERREALGEIRDQWQRALGELKNYGLNVYSMPWFMLVGEPASGKTTTLRNSGLEFPIGTEALSGFGGTRNCDWWFTNEAVILDTAGRFTFGEKDAPDAEQWQEFLRLLRRFRPRCPINGVLVAVPCTSLLQDSPEEIERKAKNIRDKLTQLEQMLEIQFPVFVVITKCDLLHGFAQFFSRLPALEQRQMLGWSKPHPYQQPVADEEWPKTYNALHTTLARWRNRFLVDDPDAPDLDQMYAFPEEFRALEEPLRGYLREMFVENRYLDPLFLRGIYFTSGVQKGKPIDKACANLFSAAGGVAAEAIFEKSTAFFIRDFYRKKLFVEKGLIQPTRAAQRRVRILERVAYGVGGVLGLVLLGLLIYDGIEQKKGVAAPLEALNAFEGDMLRWAPGQQPPATAAESTSKCFEQISSIAEGKTLGTLLGGDAQRLELAGNMAKAANNLLNRTYFRLFADSLERAFAIAPENWDEYLRYRDAALSYLTLIQDSDDALSGSVKQEVATHWQHLTELIKYDKTANDTFDEQDKWFTELLSISYRCGIERPSIRPAFAHPTDVTHRIIEQIRDSMKDPGHGYPPPDEKLGETTNMASTWLQILYFDKELEDDLKFAQDGITPPYESVEGGREALRVWLKHMAEFSLAVKQLTAIAKTTQTTPLPKHANVMQAITEHHNLTFDQLEELVKDDRISAQLVKEARDRVSDYYHGCIGAISDRLFSAKHYAVQQPKQAKGADTFTISLSQEHFDNEFPLPLLAYEAIKKNMTAPRDDEDRLHWHKDLAKRLEDLDPRTVFGEKDSSSIARGLEPALQAAQGMLLAEVLEKHRVDLAEDAKVDALVAQLVTLAKPTRLDLGKNYGDVDRRYRKEVGLMLLEFANDIMVLSDDPKYAKYIHGRAKQQGQDIIKRTVAAYLDLYSKAWQVPLAKFKPELPGSANGWNAFSDAFGKGLGLAGNGKAIGEVFFQLVDPASSQIVPVAEFADRKECNAQLALVIKTSLSQLGAFAGGYSSKNREGPGDILKRLKAEYEQFADVTASLGTIRADTRENVFRKVLETAEKSVVTNAQLFSACEDTILGPMFASTLGADKTTGEFLNVLQAGRNALEVEIKAAFDEEWLKLGGEMRDKLIGKFPFADDSNYAHAGDVDIRDFRELCRRMEVIQTKWGKYIAQPPVTGRVTLRLPKPEVKDFWERVLGWGRMIGFGDKPSTNMKGIKLFVNFEDDAHKEQGKELSRVRTKMQIEIGTLNEECHITIANQEPLGFDWDFADKSTGLRFKLFTKDLKLDEPHFWPAAEEHCDSWLALPRMLNEHAAEGDRKTPRKDCIIVAEYDLDGRKCTIFHKVELPEGRALYERPILGNSGWGN